MKPLNQIFSSLLVAGALLAAPPALAVLANAWHIPDNAGDLGVNMRNPEFDFSTTNTITVYSGVQKFNNSYGTANQTGGWLFHKGATQSSWSSNALSFHLNSGSSSNNQYWKATFNTSSFGTNEVVQYYVYLTFDRANKVSNTFIPAPPGLGDRGGATTGSAATAQASPFMVRNRCAWLYHGGNRISAPGTNANLNNYTFGSALSTPGDPILTVDGVNADYTTILFTPGTTNLTTTFASFGSVTTANGAVSSFTNPPTVEAEYFRVQLVLA